MLCGMISPSEDVSTSSAHSASGTCLRCGYDLRGVPDSASCPECGLGAARSRRPTDALRDTRPAWLRSLSIGVWLMLLAVPVVLIWPMIAEEIRQAVYTRLTRQFWQANSLAISLFDSHLESIGLHIAIGMLTVGAFLVTRPEGHPPNDRADRRRRLWIRSLACVPLLTIALLHGQSYLGFTRSSFFWLVSVAIILCLPLPILGMAQLRSLARRLHSAHLAEHCLIVGWCATASLVAVVALVLIMENAAALGLRGNWKSNSTAALLIMLTTATAVSLSAIWFLYVMVRFAHFFAKESRALRAAWRAEDRSLADGTPT